MYSLSDAALLTASIIGIIIPRFFVGTRLIVYFGVVTVSCMFLVSIAGACLISLLDPTAGVETLFIRLFTVIGVANVVYISGQIEMLRRLNITRETLDAAIKGHKEKEHETTTG